MQIEIRSDRVLIDGYVNAVERKSKPLHSRLGSFVERIKKGAFKKAIERNDNVRILLNHDWQRDLGGTKDGNLELIEDNIGLRAKAEITDSEVVRLAHEGDLVGWSFGFRDVPDGVVRSTEDGMPLRDVIDLDLREVSLLDRTRTPAYEGTLVSVRAEDDVQYFGENFMGDIEVREIKEEPAEEPKVEEESKVDYSRWDSLIAEMKEDKK